MFPLPTSISIFVCKTFTSLQTVEEVVPEPVVVGEEVNSLNHLATSDLSSPRNPLLFIVLLCMMGQGGSYFISGLFLLNSPLSLIFPLLWCP